jgi:magnesium transporter
VATAWIDLEDPDAETLRATLPSNIHQVALDRILRTPRHDDEPRPRLETHDDYVFGVLVFPLVTSDSVVYQEVDVIATIETLFTIRKTPPGHTACEFEDARDAALRDGASPGLCLYTVMNEIAERFLDVVDHFDDSIDELEDHVTVWPAAQIRDEISSIRHNILHIRRTLAPTRDAARAVLDDRVELVNQDLFPPDSHRVRLAAPHPHRGLVRPELHPHAGAALEVRLLLLDGADRRDDPVAALVLPPQALDLARR